MKRGAPTCVFAIHFLGPAEGTNTSPASHTSLASQSMPEHDEQLQAQRRLADIVYSVLPDEDGATLSETQSRLRARYPEVAEAARPFLVLEALNHLHHAGWAANTANEAGDTLGGRRYWRLPRVVN